MASQARRALQGLCVAIAARGTTVVHAAPTLVGNARVRAGVSRKPVVRRMATCTIRTKHTRVKDWVCVTACTGGGQSRELTGGMAPLTIQICVGAGERELALIMIEAHIVPAGRVMAGRTILPELPVMFIVLLVAGIAIRRRSFELPVYMARLTSDVHVPALQFEGSEIMVELCRCPAIGSMTRTTIHTKPSVMRIVLLVTGMAILQCLRKVSQPTRVEVTLHASEPDVFASDLE